jgi:hypothetical protein
MILHSSHGTDITVVNVETRRRKGSCMMYFNTSQLSPEETYWKLQHRQKTYLDPNTAIPNANHFTVLVEVLSKMLCVVSVFRLLFSTSRTDFLPFFLSFLCLMLLGLIATLLCQAARGGGKQPKREVRELEGGGKFRVP